MSSTQVKVQIQHRIDTAANWTSANPTLLAGELGYESNTKKFKLGDGSTAWTSLAYVPGSGGYTAGTGVSISGSNVISASAIALSQVFTAANQTAHLALTTQEGDIVVRSDENKSYVRNSGSASDMTDYTLLATPTDAVLSVNGNTGAITADQLAAAIEAASDSNTFTDADHTKLNSALTTSDLLDEDNFATDSATKAASQQSIKAYITANASNTTYSISCVDGDNTDEEKIRLTAGGSGSGTDDIVLEAGTGLSIARSSDKITFTNTVTNTNTQLTQEQVEDFVGGMLTGNTETGITVTYQDSDGTIDFEVDSQTDNNFTTTLKNKLDGIALSANNYSISTDLLDEDNFASDSATKPASQQSTKAYVDASSLSLIDEDNLGSDSATRPPSQQSVKAYVDTADALKANLSGATFTGDVTFDGATAGRDIVFDRSDNALKFADNAKATFGTGDLQIYHDGNSYITNTTSNQFAIQSDNLRLRSTTDNENYIVCTDEAGVELYWDGSKRAETVQGGFTVTGVCSATSFSGDGSNLTNLPAAGGSVTLTANGSIAANKPVIVNSSGQAEQVGIGSASAGAQATFDASASSDGMKVAGNGEGQFLCVNVESGQYKLRSASVSGTTVTFGSESSFNPGQAGYEDFDICYVSTKDCYMMVYRGTSNYGYARCIQVSNSGSLTISTQSSAIESYGMSYISICFGNNANGWCSVNAQREQGSFRRWVLKTVAPNASNLASAPQVTGSAQYIAGYNNLEKFAQAFNADQGIFYGIFVADGDLKAEAWTIYEAGGFGRSGVLDSITSSFNTLGETSLAYDPVTKKIVAAYRNGNNGKMRVINWNGSSWDSVSTYSEHSVGSTPEHIKLMYYAPTKVMLFSYVQSGDGKVIPVTINSHSSFSNGSGFTYESNSVDRHWGAADTTDSKGVLFVYQDSANSNRPRGRFYKPPQTNLNNNFVGFADAAISNGASGSINVVGNTTTQSSLTAGKTYYVQGDGTLAATADDPIQKGGVALSATSLLIN